MILYVAVFASVLVLICSAIAKVTASRTVERALDRPAAIVFRNVQLITNPVRSGEQVQIGYDYDKREDCYPPRGYGDFYFRIYAQEPDGRYLNFVRLETGLNSIEPPGIDQHAVNTIRLPNLKPGKYALQFRAMFQCEGERDPQFIVPEPIPFVIDPA